ncbi:MAG TPA: MotA/TolQ/ExbB proton channel family protein [Spirochaetales bacterium]|nr:MotA/TolQ/ExbB proton channel family protein [Spirochaetales bacterium]
MGGWAMWPLMVFSVATVSLIIERFIYILFHDLTVDDIEESILEKLDCGDLKGAALICTSYQKRKTGASIFLAGLKVSSLGESRMESVMEAVAGEKIGSLENGFNLLIALGSIAPITGFLGTVSGMINAFRSIAEAADVNAQLVAGGIFEALITTAFGLVIAIAAITAYNIFAHVVDKFAARIEKAGSEIVTRLLLSAKKTDHAYND